MNTTLNIGLAGLGTVGGGLVRLLSENAEEIRARSGCDFNLKAVAVRNPNRKRDLPEGVRLTTDPMTLADDPDIDVVIEDKDLKVDTYRSSGAGGQHVNKTESAIRITHIPTGVIVACQNERSQHQNREVAMKMLKSKLVKIKEREHLKRIEDIKGEQQQIGWGSQIRSYVFMPYTLVKDHRTGYETGNINAVMDGEIDPFINAYLKAASQGEL